MQYIHYLNDFTLDINLKSKTTGEVVNPDVIRSIKFYTREDGRCYKCCFKNNTLISHGTTITAVLNGANLEPGVLRYIVEIEIPDEKYPDSYKKILQQYVSNVELVRGNGSTEDIDVQVMFGDTIDDKFNSYDASIIAISEAEAIISAAVSDIQEVNSVQDASINRIEDIISTIDGGTSGAIDRLDTSVNSLQRDVSALNGSVNTLTTEQETMSQNLSTATANIADVSSRVDGFEAALAKKADVSVLGNYYTTGETYTKTEVDRAIADAALDGSLPAGVVVDANYVHTDNNYSNEDKAKVRDFDLTGYPTNSSLVANYATKAELQNVDDNHPTNASVNNTYVKKVDLTNELTDYVQNTSLVANYPNNASLANNYVSMDYAERNLIHEVQLDNILEDYPTNTSISQNYVTETYVNENYVSWENLDEAVFNLVDSNYNVQWKINEVVQDSSYISDISTKTQDISTKLNRDYLTAQTINEDFVSKAQLQRDYASKNDVSAFATEEALNEVYSVFVPIEYAQENYATKENISSFVTNNDVSIFAEADLVNQQIQALQNIIKSIQTETPVLTYDSSTTTVTATGPETLTMCVDGESVANPYTFEDSGDMYHEVTATSQAEYKAISDTASLIVANFTTFYDSSINYTLNSDKKTVNLKAASPKYSGDVNIPSVANHANASFIVVGIPNFTFSSCAQLTGISIPKTVTSIGESAISSCSALASISIDSENRFYDSRENCNAIIETSTNKMLKGCLNSTIPNSVTAIGNNAFANLSITQIVIPNSVITIGDYAFSSCSNLESLTLPNTLSTIGSNAFASCSKITNIVIPDTVTTIGDYAFSNCRGITSISIPDSVTFIGQYAFQNCGVLTSATLSNGINTISKGLFSGCSNLTSCNIPNTVTTIGNQAFNNCYKLTSITIPNSVTTIEDMAFQSSGLTSITIPNSVTSIGGFAFSASHITSISIPATVTSIGAGAFNGCASLTSITVDQNNTAYDSRNNCNAIIETSTNTLLSGCSTTIIPNTVTSIGVSAFGGLTELTTITIPDTVTSIGASAFLSSGITSITIPNNVGRIEQLTFGSCSSLTNAVIGSGVTYIGQKAFQLCNALESMTILATTPPTLQSQAAALGSLGATSLTFPIYVPAASVDAYKTAYTGYKNRIQAIPEN